MKTIKITFIFIALFISFISCEKENTAIPEPPSPVQLFTPKDQAMLHSPSSSLGKKRLLPTTKEYRTEYISQKTIKIGFTLLLEKIL